MQLQASLQKLFSLFLILAGLASTGAADVVTVSAEGKDRREAIQHALAEAICRVNGATVETSSTLRQEVRDQIRGVEVEFAHETQDELSIRTASKGHVRNYDVLSAVATEAGFEVRLNACVLRFDPDNPRPGSKKTLIVDRFSVAPGALHFDTESTGAEALLSQLQDELTTRMVRSRKFSVLTRKNLGIVQKELKFISGDGIAAGERIKLDNLLGADYIVSGRIDLLAVTTKRKTIKLTGHEVVAKSADVQLTLSVYNVGTGQIEWEESFGQDYTWDGRALDQEPLLQDDGVIARTMVERCVEELASRLLKRTFQPKVVFLNTKRPLHPIFTLSVGESLVTVGEEFDLVVRGEAISDPDTGDLLGYDETFYGRLRVTSVEQKLSRAMLIDPEEDVLEWLSTDGFDPSILVCRLP